MHLQKCPTFGVHIKTMSHILFVIFIGMTIGGFASGNKTMGIIGVVGAVVSCGLGIYFQYKKDNASREAEDKITRLLGEVISDEEAENPGADPEEMLIRSVMRLGFSRAEASDIVLDFREKQRRQNVDNE